MKKFAPIVALAFFGAMAFTACKKDYSCKCTATIAGVSVDTSWSLGKQKKKDAKSTCDAEDKKLQDAITFAKANGIDATGKCDIK
jgi:hypothetical protein